MKVYRVVAEREGATTRQPNGLATELMQEDFRYAAESIQEVWDAIEWLRNDPERNMLAVIEEHPAITILQPGELKHG